MVLRQPTGHAVNSNPPRILIVLSWMVVGGAEKLLLDVCTGLSQRGYELHFATTNVAPDPWATRFSEVGFVYRLPYLGYIPRPEIIPRLVIQLATQIHPDLVMISNSRAGYQSLPGLRAALPMAKVLDILHGQGGSNEGGGFPHYMQRFESQIDVHVTVTHYLRDYMLDRYGNDPHRIEVIHNGVDLTRFQPRGGSAAGSPDRILWVGRFSPEKHPDIFVQLAARLHDCDLLPPLSFAMIGDGPALLETKRLVRELGLGPFFEFTGYVNDTSEFVGTSALAVLTSEMEGLPLVLLEALAAGVPVVSSSVGGVPEALTEDNGRPIPFDHDFVNRAADAAVSLLSDRAELRRLSVNARATAVAHFSVTNMVDNYAVLVGRLLASASS